MENPILGPSPSPSPSPSPNSHERPKSLSELPLDLLSSVFERLSFADFYRGKSVCSSWYSALRQYAPKIETPWLIVFPEYNNNYCTLFNPDEKHKVYKTKDFGLGFAKSECKSTCGSWLLMQDHRCNLYIVNLFTQERFNLPFWKSQRGWAKIKEEYINMRSPVFWIDEKTKDYVVVWGFDYGYVVYSKKGDKSWNQIPKTQDCRDMVYKDHKLYFLSWSCSFKIFDFSGEVPRETFQCRDVSPQNVAKTKLVVTGIGDVLKVDKMHNCSPSDDGWSPFHIYKVCSSELLEKSEHVDSLDDEAIFFYLGITLFANHIKGFNKNSIYLDGAEFFNLETQKMERLCNFDHSSSSQLSKARWFLPSFIQT